MSASQDPGWRPAFRRLPSHLIPFARFGSRKGRHDLVTLRSQHLAMVSSLFAFVIAFSFIPTTKERGLQPAWGVLVLFGTTALALYEISSTQKRMGVAAT